MRILIVEDDNRIAIPLAKDLRHQHHTVDIATDGIEAWEYTLDREYDLILLDWMLPRMDGVSLCQKLRASRCQTLILMLTAKDALSAKVLGLDAGADDYLVKPFKLEELAARIRALCRRARELKPSVLKHDALTLDSAARTITYGKEPLLLTPKEYAILEYFMHHPGQVLTREALLNKLWEFDELAGEGTIKTHIGNIRSKLTAAGGTAKLIATIYGVGYQLVDIESS